MCRLTAYIGNPVPLSTLVFAGHHSLYGQAWAPREMIRGSVNADGWGVAWYPGGEAGPSRLARPEPVWHAAGLRTVLDSISAPTAVAALRNATPGLPVGPDAVPPLVLERWSFVLNGFLPAFRTRHMRPLRRLLPDHLYGRLTGVSDTETLFLLAVDALERGASAAEALDRAARIALEEVDGAGEECQLTMLLADGEGLAVMRTSNRERVNSLYRLDGGGLAAAGTLVASEPLDDDEGWTELPTRRAVEIRPGPRARGPDPSPGT